VGATRDLVGERRGLRPARNVLPPVTRCLFAVVRRLMPVQRDRCTTRRRVFSVDHDLTLMPSVLSAAAGDVQRARRAMMSERCDVGAGRDDLCAGQRTLQVRRSDAPAVRPSVASECCPVATTHRPVEREHGRVASHPRVLTPRRGDLADATRDVTSIGDDVGRRISDLASLRARSAIKSEAAHRVVNVDQVDAIRSPEPNELRGFPARRASSSTSRSIERISQRRICRTSTTQTFASHA
jgi:hypothetical protein